MSATAVKQPAISLGEQSVNAGRDHARWIEDSDPDGSRVVHLRVDTQREVDRLFHRKQISPEQHLAGTTIRQDWEYAGFAMGHLKAAKMEITGHGTTDEILSMGALEEYKVAMNQLSRDERRVVIDVIIWDEPLSNWARRKRCLGGILCDALDKLAKHYERVGR